MYVQACTYMSLLGVIRTFMAFVLKLICWQLRTTESHLRTYVHTMIESTYVHTVYVKTFVEYLILCFFVDNKDP